MTAWFPVNREKEQQERHLRELEDEMDKEIQKLEEAFKAKVGGQQDTPPPNLNGGPRTSPR